MIYITGDCHRDFSRFESLRNRRDIRYMIICGDFGGLWYGQDADVENNKVLQQLAVYPWTTLFVDGNHENFSLLNSFQISPWCGGSVHQIVPNKVIHLMRGQIYLLENKHIFTMGGASSVDKLQRIENISWWREELPNYAECHQALNNLDNFNFSVDYIVSHEAPHFLLSEVLEGKQIFEANSLSKFLTQIATSVRYKNWYFGHYHQNKDYSANCSCLYEAVIPIGEKVDSLEKK